MTQVPGIEARISVQERMITMLHGRIEELSQDIIASFQQLTKYQAATEHDLEARFDKIEASMATKQDIVSLGGRITALEGRMATKEDLASLGGHMATKEDLASLGGRMATLEQRFTSLDSKFDQLLQLVTTLAKK